MKELKGTFVVTATPFTTEDNLDEKGLRENIDWYIKEGIHGIVCAGGTGEFVSLSDEEWERVTNITIEQVNHRVPLQRIVLPEDAKFEARFEPDLLNGVVVIHGDALVVDDSDWDAQLYRRTKQQQKCFKLRAIPYYAWDNRQPGEMQVWVRTDS